MEDYQLLTKLNKPYLLSAKEDKAVKCRIVGLSLKAW
jgi:hypothetical protein